MTIEIQQLLSSPREAFLFDLDGTLVDTMPLHYAAYAEVFGARGLHLREPVFMSLIGAPAREAIPLFLEGCGHPGADRDEMLRIHAQKKDVFNRILQSERPTRLPAADVLDQAVGVKRCALVSSGNRRGVEAIVRTMGWADRFETIVTGDDVATGKPGPEPFERAASDLRLTAADCLVFEDTPDGIASARAAGMEVIDVAQAKFT